MLNPQMLIDSTRPGFAFPASWGITPGATAGVLDMYPAASALASFLIITADVALTWDLSRTNFDSSVANNWESFIAAYRILDPLFIDPILGGARAVHHVSFRNPGAAFVKLSYTAANWTGPNRLLQVVAYWDANIVP